MAITNFNSPANLQNLAVPSAAEAQLLQPQGQFHMFGRPGLASALAHQRQQNLDSIIGSIDHGNDLRAALLERELGITREKNALDAVTSADIAQRLGSPLDVLSSIQQSGGQIPGSSTGDTVLNTLYARQRAADVQKTLGEGAEAFNNAGITPSTRQPFDPSVGVLPDVQYGPGSSERVASSAALGQQSTTMKYAQQLPDGRIVVTTDATRTPVAGAPAAPVPGVPAVANTTVVNGVQVADYPQDPVGQQAIQTIVDLFSQQSIPPGDIAITHSQAPGGTRRISVTHAPSGSSIEYEVSDTGEIVEIGGN